MKDLVAEWLEHQSVDLMVAGSSPGNSRNIFFLVSECLPSFQTFFYDFKKIPGVPGGPKQFFRSCRSLRMSNKLVNIFLRFLKDFWSACRSKTILQKLQNSYNVCQASKYFSMIFKRPLDCLEIQNIFLKLQKLQNVWQACKYFCMILKDSWSAWRSQTFF